jgi:CHAD domain-containing protein
MVAIRMCYGREVSPAAHVTTHVLTVLSRAIRVNASRLVEKLPKAIDGDKDAIHDVRVASRRLRAALPIAGEATGTDVRGLVRDVRRVTRALSGIREADVVLELVHEWSERDPASSLAFTRLETRCEALRDRQLRIAREDTAGFDADDLTMQAQAVARELSRNTDPSLVSVALAGETRRRTRDLQEAIAETGIVYAVEPLHRIRLAAKKLRYVLEVGSKALPGTGATARRQLRQLQTRLGDLHDLQILQQHVRAAAAEAAVNPVLANELTALDRSLEVRCRHAHAVIMRTRPRLEAALTDVDHAAGALVVPRAVGRMARAGIHTGPKGRKVAAG